MATLPPSADRVSETRHDVSDTAWFGAETARAYVAAEKRQRWFITILLYVSIAMLVVMATATARILGFELNLARSTSAIVGMAMAIVTFVLGLILLSSRVALARSEIRSLERVARVLELIARRDGREGHELAVELLRQDRQAPTAKG